MSEYKLAAEPRSDTGKGANRRARAAGRVPAVLYGHGMAPEHLSIDAREFGHALRTGANVLIALSVGSKRRLALAKEVQRHPVRGTFIHVDFLLVRRGEKVHVQVPVHLVGEAPGVREGGIADQDLYQANVEAEVTSVPEQIEADVSGLALGDVLRVADLKAPEGATILDDPEAPVVSIVAPRVVEEAEEAEEAAEGEEGTKATAEGGAEEA
ncbi:MAG TPA: 50S ribosomal protein L25/general stress protein Ctc [Actinomycetes bacterium]|jgi:large subunit ribosomal protein L25|nr:50S ribosomal protein L25/general stress protein Ctc [Actinomycetes bacterium]